MGFVGVAMSLVDFQRRLTACPSYMKSCGTMSADHNRYAKIKTSSYAAYAQTESHRECFPYPSYT